MCTGPVAATSIAAGLSCMYYGIQGEALKAAMIPTAGSVMWLAGRFVQSEKMKEIGKFIFAASIITTPGSIVAYTVRYIQPNDYLMNYVGFAISTTITACLIQFIAP